MNYNDTFVMARKMDKNRLAAARIRIRYLTDAIDTYIEWGDDLGILWAKDAIEECMFLLRKGRYEVEADKNSYSNITQEDIEMARRYPIDKLISFTNGKALAFCHQDSTPSLSHYKKGNKATCFVCGGKSYDPIRVLMERDGMTFKDAVRYLR